MNLLTLAICILPSVFLLIYTKNNSKNYVEHSPSIYIKLFFFGILSTLPAYILEGINQFAFFELNPYTNADYSFKYWFICVGLVEEFAKFIFLYFFVLKNDKDFKCLFDGVSYSVSVALGFAVFENIIYAIRYEYFDPLSLSVQRSLHPGHFAFAIIMGVLFSEAKKFEKNNTKKYRVYILMAIIIPSLIHAMFDYICSVFGDTEIDVFMAVLFIYSFFTIKAKSKDIFFI